MNKSSIKKNFFKQLDSELPHVSGIDLPKKKSKGKVILLSTLIPAALVTMLVAVLIPVLNRDTFYIDITRLLDKFSLGESTIQNISKYSAIGVTNINTNETQKNKLKLLDLSNDELDADEENSYSLVGLTTDGVVEELNLLTSGGESIKSSKLNITFYSECGDFIMISALPMKIDALADYMAKDYKKGMSGDSETIEKQTNEYVFINLYRYTRVLNYPLYHSVRYYDSNAKSYKYIDTSYLIHKPSGKIYPCSRHSTYIDPEKINNGYWFFGREELSSDEINPNELTIGDMILSSYYYPYIESERYPLYQTKEEKWINKNTRSFHNGFSTRGGNDFANRESFGIGMKEGCIAKYDDSTSNIVVNSFDGISFIGADQYGNILSEKNGSNYIYKQSDETFVPVGNLRLDYLTKRFVSFDDDNGMITFYNDKLNAEINIENSVIDGKWKISNLLFLEESGYGGYYLNRDEKVFAFEESIYKLDYAEIEENVSFSVSKIGEAPFNIEPPNSWDNLFVNNSLFTLRDNVLYRINLSKDYECSIIDLDSHYTISHLYTDECGQFLMFRGIENGTLKDVDGYILEDGTVTFEIKENQRQISVFSPIN